MTEINYLQELADISDDLSEDYKLMRNLDFDSDDSYDQTDEDWETKKTAWTTGTGWTPLGTFTGTFNGQGYTISNLFINENASTKGLFTYIEGTIRNLGLVDVDITCSSYSGGFCRTLKGNAYNCYVTGSLSASAGNVGLFCGRIGQNTKGREIRNCYTTGSVSSSSTSNNAYLGGFFGSTGSNQAAFFYDCYSTASVTFTGSNSGNTQPSGGFAGRPAYTKFYRCYSTGNVDLNLGNTGGGFVGYANLDSAYFNCYSTGNVSGAYYIGGFAGRGYKTDFYDCYSKGAIDASSNYAGFLGNNFSSSTATDCFFDYETAGTETEVVATKKTTTQMKTLSTFSDWNIVEEDDHFTPITWYIDAGNDYPKLGFQKQGYTTLSKIVIGDSSSIEQTQRKLARASDGRLWVTYRKSDGSDNHAYVAYSDDEGETWTAEKVSSVAAGQGSASIAIDSADNVHLVWSGSGYGDYTDKSQIVYCKRTTTWGSIESVTNIDVSQGRPDIAIDSDDNVHVVWYGTGWGDYTDKAQIQYRKRTSSWQTQEAITNIDANQYFSCISVDSADNIHVAWQGAGYGDYTALNQILYRKRTSSWQTLEEVTNVNAGQNQPFIAIDSDDNIHLTWYGAGWGDYTASNQILYAKRTSSWATTELVTNKNASQYLSSIALDSDDNVHIVWDGLGWGTNTAVRNIQYRKKTDSWQIQVGITDNSTSQRVPILIYANYPTDLKTNIPKEGFVLVYMNDIDVSVVYYGSANLEWQQQEVSDTGNFFQLF